MTNTKSWFDKDYVQPDGAKPDTPALEVKVTVEPTHLQPKLNTSHLEPKSK